MNTIPKVRCVIGLLFDTRGERVLLIRKNRPAWQAGKWNGIGGKIEPGETPAQAMRREAREECGVDTDGWVEFCEFRQVNQGTEYTVTCFLLCNSILLDSAKQTTDEEIRWTVTQTLFPDCMPNVKLLVTMALNRPDGCMEIITT